MNKLIMKSIIALNLTLGSLASAQAPIAFQNVQHHTSNLSSVVNDTWLNYTDQGFTGSVKAMSRMSVTYVFEQGPQLFEVISHQVGNSVTVITKNMNPPLLISRSQ